MANNVNIKIKFPTLTSLRSDLSTILGKLEGDSEVKLKFDTTNLSKDLSTIANAIKEIKKQTGSLKIISDIEKKKVADLSGELGGVAGDVKELNGELGKLTNTFDADDKLKKSIEETKTGIGETVKEVRVLNQEFDANGDVIYESFDLVSTIITKNIDKVKELKSALNSKVSGIKDISYATGIDEKLIDSLQKRVETLSTNTSVDEFNNLGKAITDLGNSSKSILKLQNELTKYEEKVSSLKTNFSSIIPEQELSQTVAQIGGIKAVIADLQNGGNYNNDEVNTFVKNLANSFTRLANATKEVDSDGKLIEKISNEIVKYEQKISALKGKFKDIVPESELSDVMGNLQKLQAMLTQLQNGGSFSDSEIMKGMNDLSNSFTRLSNQTSQVNTDNIALRKTNDEIVKLEHTIKKHLLSLDNLKANYKDAVNPEQFIEARTSVKALEDAMEKFIETGEGAGNFGRLYNEADISMKKIASSTQRAYKEQQKHNKSILSFGGALSDVAKRVGVFSLVYDGISLVKNEFRDGLQSVIDMDTALTDLNKVVSLSKSELVEMRNASVSMGQALGRSAVDVAKAQAEFGRMYKDTQVINELVRTSIIGANTMGDVDSDEVAKGLTTIMSAMKMEASEAMTIIDSLNEVQNNYKISSKDLLDGLAEVGSVANVAGISLDELNGYMTAIQLSTGQTGSEIGTSLNSILSRLYRVGAGGIEASGKSEKALEEVGVSVRNLKGEFRTASDILGDLNSVWGTLTQTEQIYVAQQIAGTQRFNELISLMQNYSTAIEATGTSMNSFGSATKENELYIDSIAGRMESLEAKTQGFWFNFIDSDAVKNGISLLSSLVSFLDKTQEAFGSLGMSAGVLTTAFLAFSNNPLKAFSKGFLGLDEIINDVAGASVEVESSTKALGTSMTATATKTTALSAGFKAVNLQAVGAKISVMALQTVLSIGIGLAITAVVALLSGLISSFKSTEDRVEALTDKTKNLAESFEGLDTKNSLLEQYKKLNEEADDISTTQERAVEIEKELLSLKKQIADTDSQAYFILNDTKRSYEEQIEAVKRLNNEKLKQEAKELDKSLGNGFFGADEETNVKKAIIRITDYTQRYNELIELEKQSTDGRTLFNGIQMDAERRKEEFAKMREEISSNIEVVESYNNAVDTINQTGAKTSRTKKTLAEDISNLVDKILNSTEAFNDNTEAQRENNEEDLADVYSHSKDYADSFNETLKFMDELNGKVGELNENNAITTDLMDFLIQKYGDTYPELMANITDTAYVQDFLNGKIKEQEEIANTTFQSLIAHNEKYYKEKLLADSNFVESFRQSLISMGMSSEEAYALDLSQFKNLQELKAYTMSSFQEGVHEWISGYIDITASGYNIDLNNFSDVASAKLAIIKSLNEEVKKVTRNLQIAENMKGVAEKQSLLYPSGSTKGKFATAMLEKSMNDIDEYQGRLNDLNGAMEEIDDKLAVTKLDLTKYLPDNELKSGTAGGSGSSGSSKEIENLKLKKDGYYELNSALKDVENQLAKNDSLEESIGAEKHHENEVRLLNQKLEILKKIKDKEDEEAKSLKKTLASSFTFNEDGLIKDYDKSISKIEAWANNSSGEEKERRKEQANALIENATRYMSLVNESIPDLDKTIIDTSNQISESITAQTEKKINHILDSINKLENEIDKKLSDIDFEQKINGDGTISDSILFDTKRLELSNQKLEALSEEYENLNKIVTKTTEGQELLSDALGEVSTSIQEEKIGILELTESIEKFRVDKAIEDISKLEKIADDKLKAIENKQQYYADYSYDDNINFESSKLDTSKNKLQDLIQEYAKLKSMTVETVEGKKALGEAIEEVEDKIDSEKSSVLELTENLEKLKLTQLSSIYDDKVWQKGTQQNNKIDLELQVVDDDDSVSKIRLMNEQLEINKSMVIDTKKYIQDLRDTNVTTAEGYGELVKALMSAEEQLHSQESSVISLEKSMNDLVEGAMTEYIEQLRKIDEARLEMEHSSQLSSLESEFFRVSSDEYERYQSDKINSIREEISIMQDKLYLDRDNLALLNLLRAKQQELNDVQSESYHSITDWHDTTTSMYEDRIDGISAEIDALKDKKDQEDEISDRLEKQNELIEIQNKLNDIKNNKNIRELQKNKDGSWGFSFTYDKEEYENTQENYKQKQQEIADWERELEYKKQVEALELQKEFYQKSLEELKKLYEEEKKMLEEKQALEKQLNEEKYNEMLENVGDYVAEMIEKFGDDVPEAIKMLAQEIEKGEQFIAGFETSLSELFNDSLMRETESQEMMNLFNLKYGQLSEGSRQFFTTQAQTRAEANNLELMNLAEQNLLVQTATQGHLMTLAELYSLGWASILEEMKLQLEAGYMEVDILHGRIESRIQATLEAIARLRSALAELNSVKSAVASASASSEASSTPSVPTGDVTTNARSINIQSVNFPHASSANSIESALRNIDTKAVQYAERR